ncbi:hypothetical protein QM012_006983 [Aureobasidium pullulans]|uniref:TPX2 C-terminal domain-containing protein n=1 Tax=Aureobasidium pullulans TaxID=5580 RepID=A0ABR0TQ46_AURPU
MRMTRAQAAALAAAEAEAEGVAPEAINDNNEHDEIDARNDSATISGDSQEREALAELTTNLDTSTVDHDGLVDNHEPEDVEIAKDTTADQTNGHAQDHEQEEQQGTFKPIPIDAQEPLTNCSSIATSAPTPSTNNHDKPQHISIHQDETLQPPHKDVDAGSPTTELPLLNITPQRTPAKNIIKNEFAHMRSTSNKENMVPDGSLVAGPVDRLQTHVELLGAAPEQQMQTPQQVEQPQTEQKTEDHDHTVNGEAQVAEPASTQAEEGQDDSLIGHFEALQVSPKKQKFSEQEVAPDAEQSVCEQPAVTNDSTGPQQEVAEEAEKQTDNATKRPIDSLAQSRDKENKAAASSKTKNASASSQSSTSKPVRKSSVRQSTLGRQSSVVRKSMAPPSRPEPPTSTAIKRTTSVKRSSVRPSMAPRAGSSQSTERGAPADIPHSKPRPMSMSFPTPPPPPKSSKAPTQSTFQLPGEAIAAKLKAEKEERLRRQAESGTTAKPTYKPPPPPKSTKAPTRSTFQLPGEAIAAKLKAEKEERQKRQEENGGAAQKPAYVPPAAPKSTKPVTKATFQLSSDAFAAKMKAQKEARLAKQKEEEEKKEKERGVFKARPVPKMSKPAEVRQTNASRARLPSGESTGLKRASSVRDTTTTTAQHKRMSSFHPSASISSSSSTLAPRATTSLLTKRQSMAPSSKGKEVFNRAAEAKEKEEREKREKEEAAKKARAEAAERSRQASREWAAKKKEKEERRRTAAAVV